MKKESLRDRLLRYLYNQHGWVSSGQIQRVVMENSSYQPRTAVRRLQEMVEDGLLDVQIRNKSAWYCVRVGVKPKPEPNKDFIRGVGVLKTYDQLVKEGKI